MGAPRLSVCTWDRHCLHRDTYCTGADSGNIAARRRAHTGQPADQRQLGEGGGVVHPHHQGTHTENIPLAALYSPAPDLAVGNLLLDSLGQQQLRGMAPKVERSCNGPKICFASNDLICSGPQSPVKPFLLWCVLGLCWNLTYCTHIGIGGRKWCMCT